ncbi:protein DEFECTIVE IN MERISTEM SILENCING 3 isoform X1 [Ziziphus jujuba]|uniref:Protein DEFECTIVE IN MERISTEM SILENCING 3 isoform X1 n=1 Tax=Ziziphus jujuba TaxID=326968 RepID=A0A6P4AR76_ZIZJJ|nr:protein DEFECTIVE IN MERISTEM SILENCING 3 isoform X1 [Ziziphus jujuba]
MSKPNFQDNLVSLEDKIRQHEDNLKFLTNQTNQLDESILDLQVSLVKYHSTNEAGTENKNGASHNEEETMEQILRQEKSAAGILCQLNSQHASQALNSAFSKDVLGIVANLARVDDDNLSRLLSEYLGLETMLAIVCRTYEGVKALEKYDGEGTINSSSGLHGLGSSIGKKIKGRFVVICLEDLRHYVGGFIADDPQKKLALPKPRLPNGECPDGFVDYAVNIISLESRNLTCLTGTGHGLRETLFYNLFSRLQIYKTRTEMLVALPCIHDGALSLDGGMIKKSGIFALGSRKDMEVKFPVITGESDVPASYIKTENTIRMLKWERTCIAGDIRREEELIKQVKANFQGQT